MAKALSYSEIWKWKQSKEAWYKQYVLGEEEPKSPEMTLGSIVHELLEKGSGTYKWREALAEAGFEHKIPIVEVLMGKMAMKRLENKEQGMSATFKTKRMPEPIQLFGFMDGIDFNERILCEYKTSEKDERWNQFIADATIQLSFYALMYRINYHAYFREMQLHYLNTSRGTVETFYTNRGPKDIEFVSDLVEHMVMDVQKRGLWNKRLTTEERKKRQSMIPLFAEPAKELEP